MKGLLVKDFRLLLGQRRFFITMLVVAAALGISGQDVTFIISYLTMFCIYFSASTISYDEYNNGYAFLFTMPVSRKGYALEKYLFSLITGGTTWILVVAALGTCTWLGNREMDMMEWLVEAFALFLAMGLMAALLIPLKLKFGQEKSQMVLVAFFGVFAATLFVAEKYRDSTLFGAGLRRLVGAAEPGTLIVLGCILYVALMAASVLLSVRIIKRKQF